jgi:hypothetical protein
MEASNHKEIFHKEIFEDGIKPDLPYFLTWAFSYYAKTRFEVLLINQKNFLP